jgi:hypothetical protein
MIEAKSFQILEFPPGVDQPYPTLKADHISFCHVFCGANMKTSAFHINFT